MIDAKKSGKLRVLSTPTATLFLNSNTIGRTPFEANEEEGEYLLKMIPETVGDTASWSEKIKIYKGAVTYVAVDLGKSNLDTAAMIFSLIKSQNKELKDNEGELEVDVEPAGSTIQVDRDERGIAPSIITPLLKGEHELTLLSPGFLPRTQKVNIESGMKLVAKVKLAVDANYKGIDVLKSEFDTRTASEAALIATNPARLVTPSSTIPTPIKTAVTTLSPTVTVAPKVDGKTYVVISNTPVGFLRVRSEPSVSASEAAQVKPKDRFEMLEEKTGWYKIMYEDDKFGWVYSQYAVKE